MLEMMTKLSEAIKDPVFPFFLLTLTYRNAGNVNVKLKKKDLADNEAPGDNFPFIAMNGYRMR